MVKGECAALHTPMVPLLSWQGSVEAGPLNVVTEWTFLMQEDRWDAQRFWTSLILNFEVLNLHTSLQLLSGFFFFLPLNVDDLDILACSCWDFWHMSRFLRHTFPVIPPDKFYSITWCVRASECVCGSITRSITLQMKSNETCSYTGRSSECIGVVFNTGNKSLWGV